MTIRNLIAKLVFNLGKRTVIDGVAVSIWGDEKSTELMLAKVRSAHGILHQYDPRRFKYIRRDVKRLLVFGRPGWLATYRDELKMCEITDTYVNAPETTPSILAATVAHEATHGRLFYYGIGYAEPIRYRVERACFRAELSFARKLPDIEAESKQRIIDAAKRSISRNPSDWSDEAFLNRNAEAMAELGAPRWMIDSFRKKGAAAIHKRRQKPSSQTRSLT